MHIVIQTPNPLIVYKNGTLVLNTILKSASACLRRLQMLDSLLSPANAYCLCAKGNVLATFCIMRSAGQTQPKRMLWPIEGMRTSRRQRHSRASLGWRIGIPFLFISMLTMQRLTWRHCPVSISIRQSPPTRKVLWTETANL